MKVSLQKLASAYVSIKNIEKEKASNRWAYGITKNKAKMQPDIDGIQAAEVALVTADNERVKYCNEKAEKDKDGKPIIENGMFKGVKADSPELKVHIDNINKLNEGHKELLATETEIDFYMIDFKDIPEQISPVDLENLMVMIKEPEGK
jgi:hypothetical protein